MGRDFEAIRRAIDHLFEVHNPSCVLCASKKFGGGSAVVALRVIDHESYNGRPPDSEKDSVEVVPIHCTECGRVELFELGPLLRYQDPAD